MRRVLLGGIVLTGLVASTSMLGMRSAGASETYERATNMKCEQCHKHTKEEFKAKNITGWDATQDYKKCGTECSDFLKKQLGYTPLKKGEKRTEEETKKWAVVLLKGKFKCSDPNAK